MNIEHGEISIGISQQLLEVTARGAFNLAGTEKAYATIEQSAQTLIGAPWVKLTDFRQCMLGGPECLALITRHNRWCIDHGCVAMALVVDNNLVRDIYRARTAASGLPLLVFTDLDEARNQLLQALTAHPSLDRV